LGRAWTISAVAVAGVLAAGAPGQPFGRFGYQAVAQIPDFRFELGGFRAKPARSDLFRFPSPTAVGRVLEISAYSATYWMTGQAGGPNKLRLHDYAPGLEMYFPQGVRLELSATRAPYLSWTEGSVGPGVPTPATGWVLVSFQDDQPPVLIASPSGRVSLQLDGRPGNWRLTSAQPGGQWLRFALPFGQESLATVTVADLGEACARVRRDEALWVQPAPKLLRIDAKETERGVLGTWIFDQPLVRLPWAAWMAPAGGYSTRMPTPRQLVPGPGWETPMAYARDGRFSVEFPMMPVRAGRSVVLGVPDGRKMPLGSAFQLEYVFQLAWETLLATPDASVDALAVGALNDYFVASPQEAEPWTGQRLPFRSNGEGLDLAAAQAFLAECLATAQGQPAPNPLLTSVLWTRDARTWLPSLGDPILRRRAAALAALAGWISTDPAVRLEGALFEAGLAAERGLALWQRERGQEVEIVAREPVERLRRQIFSSPEVWSIDPFLRSLRSGIRIAGEQRAALVEGTGRPQLVWSPAADLPRSLRIVSANPFELQLARNLRSLTRTSQEVWDYVPFGPGRCEAEWISSSWGTDSARFIAPPTYTETSR